eukprot:COSAG01_NODE_3643_length_5811_cov_7.353967_3_plen_116_part_00
MEGGGGAPVGRAVAIYPRVLAMANHSCWPNAVRADAVSAEGCGVVVRGGSGSDGDGTARGGGGAVPPESSSYVALGPIAAGCEVTQVSEGEACVLTGPTYQHVIGGARWTSACSG